MEMGHREYARHRGVTLGAVQKAIRDKRISLNENNKIDSVQADADWTANTDPTRNAMTLVTPVQSAREPAQMDLTAPDATLVSEKDEPDELTGNDKNASVYREHRAERERYNAAMQKLEYEERVNKLIDVEVASRIVYTSFRALRDSLGNVATRIKDQLAAATDAAVCEQLVEDEIAAVLAGIDVAKLLKESTEEEA